MSNGLDSLPRYSYDPRTQTYQLLNPPSTLPPLEPVKPIYPETDGDGNPSNPGDGRSSGSGGFLGGLGLGLMGLAEAMPISPVAQVAGAIGSGVAGVAADKQAETMQDLARMNEQAIQSKTEMGLFGPTAVAANPNPVEISALGPMSEVSVTGIAPGVSPGIGLGEPGQVSVSSIGPDAVSGLAAMNAAQEAQNQAQTSPAAVAASVAEAVASDPAAAAEAAEAAADAAGVDAGDAGVGGGDGGMGGVDGSAGDSVGGDGDGGAGASGAASGDSGGATSGEGLYKGGPVRYQFGGSIMGMGESQPNYAYAPIMMASGGLPAAARAVQDRGRGDDSMLVHMTPGEVKGLQALAMANGGSLSINPQTGLPEAGFLKNILPMVAGAALAATGVGAPMAALMVGGGTALFSGSLEKGLMAGLGAFGGAGLGSALAATGAATTAGQAVTPALQQAAAVTPQAVSSAVPGTATAGIREALVAGSPSAGAFTPAAATTVAPQVAPTFMGNVSQMGTGLKALAEPAGRTAFMQNVGGPMGLVKTAGAAAAPMLFSAEEPDTGGKKPQEYIRPYAYDVNRQDTEPGFAYRTGAPGESTAELTYFSPKFSPLGVFKAGSEPGGSFYGTPTAADYERYSRPKGLAAGGPVAFAKGGMEDGAFVIPADVVSHLGNGSNDAGQKILARGLGAKPIKGKGDGMSDSIPTMIAGKREARVADGEAYVPAAVVKKVGAKRLYAMMDKIRKARTGTGKQAPEINPRKYLPV